MDWEKLIQDMYKAAIDGHDSVVVDRVRRPRKHNWVSSVAEDEDGGVLDIDICKRCGIDSVLADTDYCEAEK